MSKPKTVTIYVQLLNERVDVARPTEAIDLGEGLFRLLPTADYDPEDEEWEFLPGSIVKGEYKKFYEGVQLVAVQAP